MTKKDEKLIHLINEYRDSLIQSIETLQQSYDKCNEIGTKKELSFEESESFDALTSKFARTSDLYTQGILKTIPMLIREDANTFLDRANLGEKLGFISTANELIQIRDLRNTIVHEYAIKDLNAIYERVLDLTPMLINIIGKTIKYIDDLIKKMN